MFTLVASQRKRREIDPILNTLRRCKEQLTPEALGPQAEEEGAQARFQRVSELLKVFTLMDSLAQKFFESHRSLREAVEILSQEENP
jgi:ribonuclease D